MMRKPILVVALLLVLQVTAVNSEEQAKETHVNDAHGMVKSGDAELENKAPAEPALEPPHWPAVMSDIRALYALQDAASAGHREAATLQMVMLQQIGRKLVDETSSLQPNVLAQSVVGFVLSGGNPATAEALADREGLSALHRKLLSGAASYMRGQREKASGQLADIDALLLQPSVAARVALVQAMLETQDASERQALLSIAIAMMPGSLVEESALRRSTLFYAETGPQKLFWKRADRYIRRFPRSLYAGPFLLEVMNGIIKFESDGGKADRTQIDVFLAQVAQSDRRSLYLQLARLAAGRNLVDLATFSSRRSLRLSIPGSREAQMAGLYSQIFAVTSDASMDAAYNLRSLNGKLLPSLERQLLEASLSVSSAIRQPVVVDSSRAAAMDNSDEVSELQKAAEVSLAGADEGIRDSLQ